MKQIRTDSDSWLTECVFRVSFGGNMERLEQYERKGRVLLQIVSGVSGLNSYKNNVIHINTNVLHFWEQCNVYCKILRIMCTRVQYID